jgi:hypothetical protein
MSAHPAVVQAAKERFVALATALEAGDTELMGVAINGLTDQGLLDVLCYALGTLSQVWTDYAAEDDGETWPEFLQSVALHSRRPPAA